MEFKDWFDVVFKIVGTIGGLIAAFKAVAEIRLNRIVRQQELRWKQAASAKALMDELFDDPKAKDASLMLDWNEREYSVNGQTMSIDHQDLIKALRTTDLDFSAKETYIRDCFDYLFYYIQMTEQSLQNEAFQKRDIEFPLGYYARIIRDGNYKKALRGFLKAYHYEASINFFERFGTWG